MVWGVVVGLVVVVVVGLVFGVVVGLVVGLVGGLVVGLFFDLVDGLVVGLVFGLVVGLVFGLVVGLVGGLVEGLNFLLVYLPTFAFFFLRPFYLIPHLWQYGRASGSRDPFNLLRRSPVYWDELIATPLPRLKDWLVDLAKRDRERGLQEILFVAKKHPFQRKAAFKALLAVAEQDLQVVHDVKGLVDAPYLLSVFPFDDKTLPKGLDDARRRLNTISTLAHDYQFRLTPDGQLKVLEELRQELETFRGAMAFTAAPVGTMFQPLAARWLELVKTTEAEIRWRLQFTALPNPFVFGNPLQPRDESLFVGRRDILRALESYILNTNQRPSLLLYGRRRTGKSSTLLNLPRSKFEPVYMDCQDAKWHESDQAFCYNLAHDMYAALHQREAVKGIAEPQLEQFGQNAFTRLDQYLDQFEKLSEQRGKRILLAFDEYEGLEESITGGDVSKNVLGKLRNIIQHRQRIVVLVSGSHRFEELTGVNWASYLINTRTLELSFLDEASARELLTEPVPQLQYEAGVLDEILRLTHCQPYLLQAVASELVNHLNEQQKTKAMRADLDAAVEKVLVSAGAYFANTWRDDNSEVEQAVLRAFATGEGDNVLTAEYQAALQSLRRKEMLVRTERGYRLAVPLFGRWIVKNQVAEALPEPLVRVA